MQSIKELRNNALDEMEVRATVDGNSFIDRPDYFIGCYCSDGEITWKTARASRTPRASSRNAAMSILQEFGYRG